MRTILTALVRSLTDLCFPILCFGCGASGEWLCNDCRRRVPIRIEQRCPGCMRQITPSGETCAACADTSPIDGLFAALHYRVPIVSRIIHTCKYRFLPGTALPLAELLADALDRNGLPLPDIIIPVPLHPRRLRFRGFNQSAEIARHLAECLAPGLDLPILEGVLLRKCHTRPQVKASKKERLRNLRGAFAIAKGMKKTVSGKTVWLVDDVATTGATLAECARALKKSGVTSVFGIVIAR